MPGFLFGLLLFVFIIFTLINLPKETVSAIVVDKYISNSPDGRYHYIVFDALTPDGAIDTFIGKKGRIALVAGRKEYPLIFLQDSGRLTFKGRRLINFERYQ